MPPLSESIKARFEALQPVLDEKTRRLWAGAEAWAIGRGGIARVSESTGMSRDTVRTGLREVQAGAAAVGGAGSGRLRRAGGGRKRLAERDPELLVALEGKLDPVTRGDPMSPLRWTCLSAARLAEALRADGHQVSGRSVNRLLHALGYSLQANRKTLEGRQHPDRDAQFEYIYQQVQAFQSAGQPVISVDTKKKELVGQYRNGGREWRPQGQPEEVQVHDFPDQELGKAIPYGVYDVTANAGWVSVGIDHDTSEFAVETLRRWWRRMGRQAYPRAERLLITCDGGGSNSSRSRLWKLELQGLADELGLRVSVCHFPPGTSKWNKIEHRMFCHITQNWRGRPLVCREVVVNLIGAVRTKEGLTIQSELDENRYETGRKVSDEELARLSIDCATFHGEWNYTLAPRSQND